ncbi:MAG: trehalase, partial [Rhodanobacter sp.]
MKSPFRNILIALSFAFVTAVSAKQAPVALKTRAYIDHAWTTLTRSMDDCSALRDPKVGTQPVLYLPAGLPPPPDLAA